MESPEALKQLPGSDRHVIWVPARKTVKHAQFKLPNQLSGRKRLAALNLKIQAWSPFMDTDYSVVWRENGASVFAWDKKALSERITAHGFDPSQFEVLPEIFLRQPHFDGVRLCNTGDGIEGQVWKDGIPRVARWWKNLPSTNEWTLFLRNAGLPLSNASLKLPPVVAPDWLDFPWNESTVQKRFFLQLFANHELVAFTAALLIAPFFFFAGEWATYSVLSGKMTDQVNRIEIEGESLREDRNAALNSLEIAEDIMSLREFPHQIEIISRAHRLLSDYEVEISGWDYDEGILEFGLVSDVDMDATVYIPIFEDGDMFSRVSASTRGARLMMRMNVMAVSDMTL